MLQVQHLTKSYKTGTQLYPVLKDISFEVKKGEFVAVMGPSGSGKTTLLNCISCFIPHDEGKILLGDQDISGLKEDELARVRNEKLGFVFQDFMLLDGLTVFENICLPQIIAEKPAAQMEAKAGNFCHIFGIDKIMDKYPAMISGGEKQRISIARCILKDAPIVILDEATASVDTDNESYIQEAISELVKGKTLLVIAHRLNTIQNADQILVINNGQIAQHGTHEELLEQPGIYQDFVNIRKNAVGWSLA